MSVFGLQQTTKQLVFATLHCSNNSTVIGAYFEVNNASLG